MDYLQFEKKIYKGKIAPLYIITGEENFLKKQAVDLIKKRLGEDRIFFKQYAVEKQFNIQNMLNDLYSDALFDDYNLIILHDVDSIVSKLHDAVISYVKSPTSSSILVLVFKKLDMRTKFAKFVKENSIIVDCKALRDEIPSWSRHKEGKSEVVCWIQTRVKNYKKTIDQQPAELLAKLVGNNLSDIDLQIQKLSLFVKERSKIDFEDIKSLVQGSKKVGIFDLMESIFCCKKAESLRLLHLLFQRGLTSQDGQSIYDHTHISLQCMRLIHYKLKQIWKLMINPNMDMSAYIKRKIMENVKLFSKKRLYLCWKELLQAELSLKTSQLPPNIIMEKLILFISDSKQNR